MRIGLLAVATVLWTLGLLLSGCAAPIEGAWETKVEYPQGSDPAGFELHLTLAKFMKDETGGAAEYTIFHENARIVTCKTSLKSVSKAGGTYEYLDSITEGSCEDGMTIRVVPTAEDKLSWQRIGADGNVEMAATLDVQTGIATAVDKPGA